MKHIRAFGVLAFLIAAAVQTACGGDKPNPAGTLFNPRETGGKNGSSGDDGGTTDEKGGSAGKGTGGRAGASGAGGRAGAGGGESTGGRGGSGGGAGSSAGAGGSPAGDGGVEAPVVSIKSPVAAADPDKDVVIANGVGDVDDDKVTVVCGAAKEDSKGSDISIVKIAMLDAGGKVLQENDGAPNPAKTEYTASFVFTDVANGKVSFRCTATNTAGASATDTVSTLIDHGPTITRGAPAPNSPHPLKALLAVDFTVEEAPLTAKGDDGAQLDSVHLTIAGRDIPLTGKEDAKNPGHFSLSVDLSDRTLFPTPPNDSTVIAITATDKRNVTKTDAYHFVADGAGPIITIVSPPDSRIIGGRQDLNFTVTDGGSGVDPSTIHIDVNKNSFDFGKDVTLFKDNGGGSYTFAIDAARITGGTIQLVVNITVSDKAGNSSGASRTYYLDTVRPTIDLAPPMLQEVEKVNQSHVCSESFYPLGDIVVRDWVAPIPPALPKVVPPLIAVRALAWDDGNRGSRFYSGMNQSSVVLYVQGDVDKGLLFDSTPADDNHVCDEIDTTNLPFSGMGIVPPAGVASTKSTTAIPGICDSGSASSDPEKICPNQPDLRRVIQHEQPGGPAEPVIYALAQPGACGNTSVLEIGALQGVKEGWVCLAARGVDNAGNIGVSAPVRVCLSDGVPPSPSCATTSMEPPSCTRNCTAPPHFVPADADGAVRVPPYIYYLP